ncbi:MFS transporter [Streptomyces sp. NPDC056411]|uniref:MFS transporter n=1 Tax=Streptomyces sp. NPDC056411 TaxID=3345813 RepID=UPI0035DC954E
MRRTSSPTLVVIVLASSLCVVTSSEFQVAAMLTAMSADLGAPVADLGLLVTVYSLGMGCGGPVVAWALRRLRPRRALVLVMACYAVAEALAGATSETNLLIPLRLVAGALSGATFGMALSTGMRLSDERGRARMSAGVLTGLMAGTLLGLPLSHGLATTVGWRASFVVLAAAAAAMALAVRLAVPEAPGRSGERPASLGALRNGHLWLRYLTSFLTIGGAFTAFTFIDPLLQRAGLTAPQATLTMFGFGASAFTVNHLAGRVPAGAARGWLVSGVIAQLAALLVFLLAPGLSPLIVTATVFLGGAGIALNPLLVNRVITVGEPNVLVNTVHTSAITLGVAAATTLGSRAITVTGDLSGTVLVGLAFSVAAVLITATTRGGDPLGPSRDRAGRP